MTPKRPLDPPQNQAERPVTLSDVARAAGVSRWVAGRVLNGGRGNTRVSPATADKIRQIAKAMNYQPNPAAMLLRGRQSQTFGLLVASATDPLRSMLVQYLDAEAVKIGCNILIGNTLSNQTRGKNQFDHYVDEFLRRRIDGVFCAVHHWFEGDRRRLLKKHPYTVFYEDPGIPNAVYVTVDREDAVRQAVRHLLGRGRHRIGLAVMTLARRPHLARLHGYYKELQANGLAIDENLVFNGANVKLAYARFDATENRWDFPVETIDAAIEQLVVENQADAIIAHDDFWAATLIKRLRMRGIRVPDDVAVVGYLNHYIADWVDPALTTFDLQHAQAAHEMFSLMTRLISSGELPASEQVVKIQPKLVIRESA